VSVGGGWVLVLGGLRLPCMASHASSSVMFGCQTCLTSRVAVKPAPMLARWMSQSGFASFTRDSAPATLCALTRHRPAAR